MTRGENLFYLTGFQRSGTTMLSHLLDKHPEIVCADEPELSKRIVYKQFDVLKDTGFDSNKKMLDLYNVDHGRYLELVNEYIDRVITENAFLKRSYSLFNNKNANYIGAKEVCDLVAFKYDFIRKLTSFHNTGTKYIFIERDIKGVVNSFIKLGSFPPGKKRLSTFNLKRFAKKYVKCINYIDKHLSGKNALYLRFEDLMLRPEDEMKRIYDFLGVDSGAGTIDRVLNKPSRGARQKFNGIKKHKSDAWQEHLSKKDIIWLDKVYRKKRRQFLEKASVLS